MRVKGIYVLGAIELQHTLVVLVVQSLLDESTGGRFLCIA